MSPTDPSGPSVDDLVQELRRRVDERRSRGDYPAELEHDLDAHFDRIAIHQRPPYQFELLRNRLEALRSRSSFSPSQIDYSTRVRGGSVLHRLVGKMVSRQTAGVLEQVQAHADALVDLAGELIDALEHPRGHEHPILEGEVMLLVDRLIALERSSAGGSVTGGVADPTDATGDRPPGRTEPWFSNERFENAFRGDPDDMEARYRSLAREFVECDGPVVDIGCGRGDFLQLLMSLGVDACGIEIDPALVASAAERGLPVEFGDALPWLEHREFASLAGVSLIQVAEHLPARDLARFVALALAKVRPGGKVVVETVNPQSLYVYAHSMYLDPTHVAPVHPGYLTFLFREAGYSDVRIDWRSPCSPDDALLDVPGDSPLERRLDENVRRLNRLLFAEQDYAVIATR